MNRPQNLHSDNVPWVWPMKLPKFWRDKGTWNDPVVSAGVVLGLASWVGLGWLLDFPALMIAGMLLGPFSGFCLGIGIVAVLCRYFTEK